MEIDAPDRLDVVRREFAEKIRALASRLREAYTRGGHEAVRSLRSDPHDPGPGCWLHGERFCLST